MILRNSNFAKKKVYDTARITNFTKLITQKCTLLYREIDILQIKNANYDIAKSKCCKSKM